jgi:hypothetical protein
MTVPGAYIFNARSEEVLSISCPKKYACLNSSIKKKGQRGSEAPLAF